MRTLRDIPARPSLPVRAILRAYPRAWRERYEHELGAMLATTPPRAGQLLDLLAGAVDARLHPDLAREPGFLRLATAGPVVDPPAPTYGAVPGVAIGELSRRTFLRRMLGVGAGLLALEFIGGTLAFLWPQISEGLGSEFRLGTLADIERAEPGFASGTPYAYAPARVFLVNVPAAEAVARGEPFTRALTNRGGAPRPVAKVPPPGLPDPGAVFGYPSFPVPLPWQHLQYPRRENARRPRAARPRPVPSPDRRRRHRHRRHLAPHRGCAGGGRWRAHIR